MCGGGVDEPYDAYKAGDFSRWKSVFDKRAEIEIAAARGEITQEEAEQRLAALERPATPPPSTSTPIPSLTSALASARDRRNAGEEDPGGSSGGSSVERGVLGRLRAMADGQSGPIDYEALMNKLKSDPSASMEMREMIRQHQVNLGKIGIDKSFTNFDDNYYKGYQDDYTGYYFPQLDEQYDEVVDKMTAALAGRGMLESTVGGHHFGKLAKEHSEARTNIQNEALDASRKLRGQVEQAKSNLYNLNEASADPQAVNAQAVGQATALVAPPTYNPLGQVFASALSSLGNFAQARQNRPTRNYTSPYPTGYGSGMVVR